MKYFIVLILVLLSVSLRANPFWQNQWTTNPPPANGPVDLSGGANGTFSGNATGLTNVNGYSIAQQSTNTVYYFDCYATNAISQPNNPLAPYHYLDQVPTINLVPPTLFKVMNGIYYFTNCLTNVSISGESQNGVLFVGTNINGLDNTGLDAISTNNITLQNFTLGFIPGGVNVQTNYRSLLFDLPGFPLTNILIQNVSMPYSLSGWGIPTGGSPVDGVYSHANVYQDMTEINDVWDMPWDCNVFLGNGVISFKASNCKWNSRQNITTSNTGAFGHCLEIDTPGNGTYVSLIGCQCSLDLTNQNILAIPLVFTPRIPGGGSNITVTLTSCTVTNPSGVGDILLQGVSQLNGGTALMQITGGFYDVTNFDFAGTGSNLWTKGFSFNYEDWFGNVHTSGQMIGNGSGLTGIVGVSGLTNNVLLNQSSASTICTYTVPSATTNNYEIGSFVDVTAVTVDVAVIKMTFTDENNVSQTLSITGSITSTGFNPASTQTIRAKTGTISVQVVLTTNTGSIAYDAGAFIRVIQ